MKKLSLFLIVLLNILPLMGQTVIQMVEDGGVYKVPCEVNGLKVKMVFDTGASSVSISSSLAEMMLDNGYLTANDFGNRAKSMIADGRIIDNTKVVFKTISIGGITINNVEAVVLGNQRAPLLFGQSAIQKLGIVTIKGDKLYISKQSSNSSVNNLTERWDANNYTYSNYTYGFGWRLPNDIEWKREQGAEKHTAFRVTGGPFLVFVNAQVANNNIDLWVKYPDYVKATEALDVSIEKKTGNIVYERNWEKCTLFGQHAIKTTFLEYFKDSRYDEALEDYAEEYIFIHNGYSILIAIKVNKDIYDEYDCTPYFKQIIQGFTINTGR